MPKKEWQDQHMLVLGAFPDNTALTAYFDPKDIFALNFTLSSSHSMNCSG